MKTLVSLAASALALAVPQPLSAQAGNIPLAESIIQARQQNTALMKQYSWTSRLQLEESGVVKDTRVESVVFGPDGQPQYTQLADNSASLPNGFVRRRIAEKDREKMEAYIKGLRTFLHQYTLPSAGKVLDFISKSTVPAPDANGLLQFSGANVVVPGDTLSMAIYAPTRATRTMTIVSFFQGDQVNLSATFKTLTSGLTYLAYAQVDVASKNLSLLIQNYDYLNQNN